MTLSGWLFLAFCIFVWGGLAIFLFRMYGKDKNNE